MVDIKQEAHANVAIRNLTYGDQSFMVGHVWKGNPRIIPQHKVKHVSDGYKEAVVYSGTNVSLGRDNCAWLLAWYVRSDNEQVYVECGDKTKYEHIDWDEIEKKLDASGISSYYYDPPTNTRANGQMDLTGRTGKLDAVFGVGK